MNKRYGSVNIASWVFGHQACEWVIWDLLPSQDFRWLQLWTRSQKEALGSSIKAQSVKDDKLIAVLKYCFLIVYYPPMYNLSRIWYLKMKYCCKNSNNIWLLGWAVSRGSKVRKKTIHVTEMTVRRKVDSYT